MNSTTLTVPNLVASSAGTRRLKRLVVLDRIILLQHQWDELRSMTEELIEYGGLDPAEIMRRLEQEADRARRRQCAGRSWRKKR